MLGAGAEAVRRVAAALAVVAASATPPAAGQPAPVPVPAPVADGALHPAWRVAGLPQQKPPLTQYAAAKVDGVEALLLDARASYGNLVLDLSGRAPPLRIGWRWRLEQANPALDLSRKAGDDSPAKVCLAFDLPLAAVPIVERQLLRLARARSGEPLPSATLCWVWGHAEPVGSVIDNPFSRRVRFVVLRGRGDATGRWYDELRDVAADFRRAFGDEWTDPARLPPLSALIVGADADNTGASSRALLAGPYLEPRALTAAPPAPPR
ncbi:MAG: DUF3047 domain-containing protein [Pseudomonadota bacterium]|jgi:hypothetical protein